MVTRRYEVDRDGFNGVEMKVYKENCICSTRCELFVGHGYRVIR